jgi:hypothetical protein
VVPLIFELFYEVFKTAKFDKVKFVPCRILWHYLLMVSHDRDCLSWRPIIHLGSGDHIDLYYVHQQLRGTRNEWKQQCNKNLKLTQVGKTFTGTELPPMKVVHKIKWSPKTKWRIQTRLRVNGSRIVAAPTRPGSVREPIILIEHIPFLIIAPEVGKIEWTA